MTDPTQFSICSPATGDSPSRSRPSEWPTPAAMNPQDGEAVATWDARRELVKAKGINGNGMGEPLAIAVLRSEQSDSARSTPTPAPSSPTAGLMSPTSEPFSTSPEIQSLSDAVSSRLSSLVASLASRTQWPESGKPPTTTATSGRIAGESLGIYDPASRCSRTSQACLPLNQELFSIAYLATWPRFGTLASGRLYQQPTLARPTDASASGSSVSMRTPTEADWPTAAARDYKGARSEGAIAATGRNPMTNSLEDAIQAVERAGPPPLASGPPVPVSGSTGGSRQGLWATPRATEIVTGANAQGGLGLTSQVLTRQAGKLNPAWVEMLMGLPMGHTQLPHKFTKPRKGTP